MNSLFGYYSWTPFWLIFVVANSDGLVKSRTGDTTDKATYDGWYQTVYIPDETEG